jgi:nucleotide-binding universal stress UspA family protein
MHNLHRERPSGDRPAFPSVDKTKSVFLTNEKTSPGTIQKMPPYTRSPGGMVLAHGNCERAVMKEVPMARVKRILAPTDFSELSKVGILYALEMARDVSAEVVVYHAIDVGGQWQDRPPAVAAHHDMLEESRRLLDKFLADNFADCIDLVEVRCAVEFGTPHKNIVEKAAAEGVDMIVMSTHGRTGLNHIIMGSVAEKVVARATCPVLVVPHDARRPALAAAL